MAWILSSVTYFVLIYIGSIVETGKSLTESFEGFDIEFVFFLAPILGGITGIIFGLPGLAISKMLLNNNSSDFLIYVVGAAVYGTLLNWGLISFFSGFNGGKYSGMIVIIAVPAAAVGGVFFWWMMTEPDETKSKHRWGRN